MNEKILEVVNAQEQVCLVMKNRILHKKSHQGFLLTDNKTYAYERAKLIGMLDILDALGIDRSEFSWIF